MGNSIPIVGGMAIALATLVIGIVRARKSGESVPIADVAGPVLVIAVVLAALLAVAQLLEGTAAIVAILVLACVGLAAFHLQQRHAARRSDRVSDR